MAKPATPTKAPPARSKRALTLTRAERAEVVKRRLYEAAVTVVGEHGYAGATVSRITSLARVAQGTFYNYYPNRQDLLDMLLPALGQEMIAFIRERVTGIADPLEQEIARFRAFFDFIAETPQFMRILYEAALFAPKGYAQHMQNVTGNYIRALKAAGLGKRFSDEELGVLTTLLMGARSYLGNAFAHKDGKVVAPPQAVFSTYEKMLREGLFSVGGEAKQRKAAR